MVVTYWMTRYLSHVKKKMATEEKTGKMPGSIAFEMNIKKMFFIQIKSTYVLELKFEQDLCINFTNNFELKPKMKPYF